jgi:uncharacterized protein (UPF0303 family)
MGIEEPPDLARFTHAEAWAVGRDLVERCLRHGHPVTISIVLGTQRVFHAALAGSSADNDSWVARKIEVVRRFGRSSATIYELYAKDNVDFYRVFALQESQYAAAGGAVPIRVQGALVGVLAVSGLDSDADHRLAVEALAAMATPGGQPAE